MCHDIPSLSRAARALGIAAFSLALVACPGERPGEPPGPAGAKRLDVVRMNVNAHIGYAPFFIAKEEGFFEAEGIDARLVPMEGQNSIMALTTGDIDAMASAVRSGLFNVMVRGVRVQIVAEGNHVNTEGCQSEAFVAPPAQVARVARNGFRGENFALIRGGNMEFQISQLLQENGLSLDDVNLLLIPQGGDYLSNMNKAVEAVRYMQEPMLSNALASGAQVHLSRLAGTSANQPLSLLVFGRRLLDSDPELGRRFMRAYLRGVRRLGEGKTDRNVDIISRHSKLPPEIVRRACWQTIAPDGLLDPESLEPFFAWAKKNGHLDADVPASVWWNPTFATEASRDLGRPAAVASP